MRRRPASNASVFSILAMPLNPTDVLANFFMKNGLTNRTEIKKKAFIWFLKNNASYFKHGTHRAPAAPKEILTAPTPLCF